MQITIDKIGTAELYLQIMKAICGDVSDKSVCDLMAFHSPHIPKLGFAERTYVDIKGRKLDFKEEQKYFIKSDVIKFLKRGNRYDFMICSDGVEHLPADKGRLLISLMERYSEKQIIFTPLGEWNITNDNNPDSHRSGWMPEYFEGWASIVMPNFHPLLKVGAFFSWHCENIEQEFERVKNKLKSII